jgi:arsenate reductase
MPKVLIICTGNSCRSIMAEALINARLGDLGVRAWSAGSAPSGRVNPNAKKVLEETGVWDERYRSKSIDEALDEAPFDLVVTVCDHARESCPVFPKHTRTLHVGFEDPDGQPYEAFVHTRDLIETTLLPIVRQEFDLERSRNSKT